MKNPVIISTSAPHCRSSDNKALEWLARPLRELITMLDEGRNPEQERHHIPGPCSHIRSVEVADNTTLHCLEALLHLLPSGLFRNNCVLYLGCFLRWSEHFAWYTVPSTRVAAWFGMIKL